MYPDVWLADPTLLIYYALHNMHALYKGLTPDKQFMQFLVWASHKIYLPYSCYELEEKELVDYLEIACAWFTNKIVLC